MLKFIKVFLLVVAAILFLSACEKGEVSNKAPVQVKSENEEAMPVAEIEDIMGGENGTTSDRSSRLKKIIKLQVCPDMYIENKMPREVPGVEREYFILSGERRELEEFDTTWVEENCNLVKKIVN